MTARFTKRRAMSSRIAVLAAALTTALALTGVASAHDGSDPSSHSTTTSCMETPSSNQWSIVSIASMYRTAGYDSTGVIYTGGGNVFYGGANPSLGYSPQWLAYRVVLQVQDREGNWKWKYGTWARRQNQIGGATDGISTEVETYPLSNRFVYSSYGLVPGAREDASYATGTMGDWGQWKYVWVQMYYGPIYSGNTLVWADRYHWVPIGWRDCG